MLMTCVVFVQVHQGVRNYLLFAQDNTAAHNIVFNVNNSFGMMFSVKYCNEFKPELCLAGKVITFVNCQIFGCVSIF